MHRMPRAMRIYSDEVFKRHKARRQSRSSPAPNLCRQNSRPSNAASLRQRPKLPLALASNLCQPRLLQSGLSIRKALWKAPHRVAPCGANCGRDASEHTAAACQQHSKAAVICITPRRRTERLRLCGNGSGGRLIADGSGLSMRSDFVTRQARSKSTRHHDFLSEQSCLSILKSCSPNGVKLPTVLVLKTKSRQWAASLDCKMQASRLSMNPMAHTGQTTNS